MRFMCLEQLHSLLQKRKLVELCKSLRMNYEKLDPLVREYVAAMMAESFGDAARMKLLGVFGF